MSSLTLDARPDGDALRVRVNGEVDISVEQTFQEALKEHLGTSGPDRIVLELDGVTFIDSTGLRMLLRLKKHMEAEGRRLVLKAGEGPVSWLLDLAGVRGWFEYE